MDWVPISRFYYISGRVNVCTIFFVFTKLNIIVCYKPMSCFLLAFDFFLTFLIVRSHPSTHRLATPISNRSAFWIESILWHSQSRGTVSVSPVIGETGVGSHNSSYFIIDGPPHMTERKQVDQLEPTFSSSVRIRDVALKTSQKRWTIGRSGDRGSGISMLVTEQDDGDIYTILQSWSVCDTWSFLSSCGSLDIYSWLHFNQNRKPNQ